MLLYDSSGSFPFPCSSMLIFPLFFINRSIPSILRFPFFHYILMLQHIFLNSSIFFINLSFLNLFVFSPKTHAIICAFSLLAKFLPLFMILNSGILHPLYKKRADLCGFFPHRSVLIVQTFLFIYFIFKKPSHLLLFAALNTSDYSHNLSE